MPTWHREVKIGKTFLYQPGGLYEQGQSGSAQEGKGKQARATRISLPCRHQAEAQHHFWCLTCTPSSSVTECLWACTMLVWPAGSRAAQQTTRKRGKAALPQAFHMLSRQDTLCCCQPGFKAAEDLRQMVQPLHMTHSASGCLQASSYALSLLCIKLRQSI